MIDKSIVNMHINFYYGSCISLGDTWHDYNIRCMYSKIYYITGGECEIVILGETYHALPGDMFLIPAGVQHSFYHTNSNYIKKYWFHFEFECCGENFFDSFNFPYVVHIGKSAQATALMKNVLLYGSDTSISGQLRLKSAILDVVSFYFENAGAQYKTVPGSDINYLFKYINENLKNSFSVDELADIMHMHPNYFIKYFKQKTGYTPMKYLTSKRMEYAKSKLETSSMPICEIMDNINFSDISHFSKVFKKYSGYSPKQFRLKFYKPNT